MEWNETGSGGRPIRKILETRGEGARALETRGEGVRARTLLSALRMR